jgi:iron complex outermembrane recepter protein
MCKYTLFPIAALLISTLGLAQETSMVTNIEEELYTVNDTVKNKKGVVLQEVIVNSNQQKTPVTIGKAGIKPMDLPQATAVISGAIIDKQQINSVSDLLKNVNGVYIMGATGGYQEEIASRGSSLGSSNTFKNGIRYFSGMRTEFSGIERAEFLKGSAAILFGNVSPGGILNLVTKKPRFDFGGEAGFRFGSFNSFKPTFDIYGGLGAQKKTAFRINGAYEKADSFRQEVGSESFYVNPSFLAKLGSRTELLIEADYTKDKRTPDFGAGIINYEVVEIPRDRFLGVSWGYFDAQQISATAMLTHQLSENWGLSFVNSYRYYNTDLFSNTRPNSGGAISATGDWKRSVQRSEVNDNYFLQQLDLKGIFHTGSMKHQFLAGVDREIYKTKTLAYKNAAYDVTPINIFNDYNPAAELPIPTLSYNTLTGAPVSRVGIYAQDLVSFSRYFKLLAGLRYTYQDTESNVLTYKTDGTTTTKITKNYDDALSPRVGLIIQPSENHSIFGSYSNSFQVNTGTDINKEALEPSVIGQYEIGVKNKFFDERLFANLTVYQITNSNLAQTSFVNGNTDTTIKELTGETRSQGVELDIVAHPVRGLSLLAGYSFNETIYTESNTYIVGSQLRYNPKNTANMNINYTFETTKLKGVEIGLINTYFGQRYAGRSTRLTTPNDTFKLIPLDDFFQVDATLGYVYRGWAIRTKLSNIFNELNYNIHDDNSLNPIAPRNYSVTLNYKF